MTIDSHSVGDPAKFLNAEQLAAGLADLPASPRDIGRLTRIVIRQEKGLRELLETAELTIDGGLVGDSWGRDPQPDPQSQLAVMEESVSQLIVNGQPPELAGDNLWLDLDLSEANLPIGSRLRIGSVILEVTPLPHNGCRKFRDRFGEAALQLVWNKEIRHRNLRGIYLRVVVPGQVTVGESVEVLSRT